MKILKILLVLVLGISISTGFYSETQASTTGEFSGTKAVFDTESDAQAFPGTPVRISGIVLDDGVRLRSGPSTSATILELMYSGESVAVLSLGNTWSYVRRIKTGTYGYCKTQYIGTV